MRTLLAVALVLRALAAFAFAVQPEVPISSAELVPNASANHSSLATNGETYVAVWTGPGATYASRMHADGTLLDRIGIRVAEDSTAGGVVWNGNAFLIAYLHGDVNGGTIEVRTLTVDGIVGEPVPVLTTATPASDFRMRMATNGKSVLLVTSDSNGALLELDGTKLRELDFDWNFGLFAVGASSSAYLVATTRFDGNLKTQLVTANGDLGATATLMDTVRFGVDVASDGTRFFVVWARGNLYAQFLTQDGAKIDEAIKLTDVANVHSLSHTVTRLIRRGGEYVLVYRKDLSPMSDTLRFGNEGEIRGPLLSAYASLGDITAGNGKGGVLTIIPEGVPGVAFFDEGAPSPLRNPTPLSFRGKHQSDVQLARVDGGFAAAWYTHTYMDMPQIVLSRGPGSTPVVVVTDYAWLLDVVVEDGFIWVFWIGGNEGKLYTRRFTQTLQPLDAEPVLVKDDRSAAYHAVGAGGGAVVVVRSHSQGPFGLEPDGVHVEAHILHGTAAGVTVTDVDITRASGFDRVPAVEWNGDSFTIAWANATAYRNGLRRMATESRVPEVMPDDRILAVHMTAAGEVLESAPIEITVTRTVDSLALANGIAVWQTYNSDPISLLRHTYAARVAASATVADLGGDNTYFGAVAPEGGGFLLTRARPLDETTLAPELLSVDANLNVVATAPMAPITVGYFYDNINPYDADVIGGPQRMLGYARIAGGGYGHSDRIFVRRVAESTRRRAMRITQ